MKALDKAVISLQAVIAGGNLLHADAEQNRRDIRDALLTLTSLQDQWEYVGTRLMPEIIKGKPYAKCRIEKTNRGSYQFVDKSTGKRHEGARSFLRDRLSLTTLLAGSSNKHTRNKKEKLSPVDMLLASFEKLALKDQRAFIKALPRVI